MAAPLLPMAALIICIQISGRGAAEETESCAWDHAESVGDQALLQQRIMRHSDTMLPEHRRSLLNSGYVSDAQVTSGDDHVLDAQAPSYESLLEEHAEDDHVVDAQTAPAERSLSNSDGHVLDAQMTSVKGLPEEPVKEHLEESTLSATDGSQVAAPRVEEESLTTAQGTTAQDIHLLLMAAVLAAGVILAWLVNHLRTKKTAETEDEPVLKEAHAKNLMRIRHDWLSKDNQISQQPKPNTLNWQELLDNGLSLHMRACPKKFREAARNGIPPEFRWQVWKAAVKYNNQEAPLEYEALCKQQNAWSEDIHVDVGRTFPDVEVFDKRRQEALSRVLTAYANLNPEVGYCQWMCFPIGLLLLVSDAEEESFGVFACLMDHMGLSGFYKPDLPLIKVYAAACDQLMMEIVPKLRDHLLREGVDPAMYFLNQWFLTMFISCLPLQAVPLIWDIILCYGLPVMLSIAVAILHVLEDALLAMEFEEIAKCLNDLKRYESEQSSIESYSIAQIIAKLGQIELPPQYILEMVPACRTGETCPSGHPMIVFRTPHGSFACDMCGTLLPKDSALHGCRACNFDMCQKCLDEEHLAAECRDFEESTKRDIDKEQANVEQHSKEKEGQLPSNQTEKTVHRYTELV